MSVQGFSKLALTHVQLPRARGDMASHVRERALQREMRADCNLHPALCPPEEGPAILGHYKVSPRCALVLLPPCMRLRDFPMPATGCTPEHTLGRADSQMQTRKVPEFGCPICKRYEAGWCWHALCTWTCGAHASWRPAGGAQQ